MFSLNMTTGAAANYPRGLRCDNCGKSAARVTHMNGRIYCSVCVSNVVSKSHSDAMDANVSPCDSCPSNPKNNPYASGVCHCTLGLKQIRW